MTSASRQEQPCPVCGQPLASMEYEYLSSRVPGIMYIPVDKRRRAFQNAKEAVRSRGPGPIPVLIGGVGRYLWGFFRGILSPVKLMPGYVMGAIWLVLSILAVNGIAFPFIEFLSWLSFSTAGMEGGVLGALGGIVGKGIYAGALFRLMTKEGLSFIPKGKRQREYSLSAFMAGLGLAWMLFNFFTWDNGPETSVIGLVAAIGSVRAMNNRQGYFSSLVRSFWRERVLFQGRSMALGMALGFVLAVPLSLVSGPWSGYIAGTPLFLAGLIFGKSKLANRLHGRAYLILFLILTISQLHSVHGMGLENLVHVSMLRVIVIGIAASLAAATAAATVFSRQPFLGPEDGDGAEEPLGDFRLGVEKNFGGRIYRGNKEQFLQIWIEKYGENGEWEVFPCKEGDLSMYFSTIFPGLRLEGCGWDEEKRSVKCAVLLDGRWPGEHAVLAFKCDIPQVRFSTRMLFHLGNEN